jgi:tRNA1Val (adenine37-N6)-methyltransferase
MADIFRFKQFEVDQKDCAMRINTDGVLLAAMATYTVPRRILDIGAGTGVIALMLAQRFEKAHIDGVELEIGAANRAKHNFENSPFANRLQVFQQDILAFEPSHRYDMIVSNPPFFVNDLKSSNDKKGLARHTTANFFKQLIVKVDEILNEEGCFWFILPVKQAQELVLEAARLAFFPSQIVAIQSTEKQQAFRHLVCLSKANLRPRKSSFCIYNLDRTYTQAYCELLKEFFTIF